MENSAFWVAIGDLHDSPEAIKKIPHADKARGIIITGDLTNVGGVDKAHRIMETVRSVNPVVYAQIGNMDKPEVQDYLERSGYSIHSRGVALNEQIGLAGVGYSLTTPFGTPSEVADDTIASWLDRAVQDIEQLPLKILATHNPPLNTVTDKVADGKHVGSQAIRECIEQKQPEVVVTGHIHEAIGEEFMGKSHVLNPGPLPSGGYVLIRADQHGLRAELQRLSS